MCPVEDDLKVSVPNLRSLEASEVYSCRKVNFLNTKRSHYFFVCVQESELSFDCVVYALSTRCPILHRRCLLLCGKTENSINSYSCNINMNLV